MNAPIDTLAFAQRFEEAGFGLEQARALVAAIAQAQEAGREDLVTKAHFDMRLAEFRTELVQALGTQNLALTKAIAENGKDISNRLWSTTSIVTGVASAVSAVVGAVTALILKAGGL